MELNARKMQKDLDIIGKRIKATTDIDKKVKGMGDIRKKEKFKKTGFIYFISNGLGQIKIGWAVDPIARLKVLQVGASEAFTLLGCIPLSTITEGEIHQKFKDYRLRGEWFSYDQFLLDYIKEMDCRKEYKI